MCYWHVFLNLDSASNSSMLLSLFAFLIWFYLLLFRVNEFVRFHEAFYRHFHFMVQSKVLPVTANWRKYTKLAVNHQQFQWSMRFRCRCPLLVSISVNRCFKTKALCIGTKKRRVSEYSDWVSRPLWIDVRHCRCSTIIIIGLLPMGQINFEWARK